MHSVRVARFGTTFALATMLVTPLIVSPSAAHADDTPPPSGAVAVPAAPRPSYLVRSADPTFGNAIQRITGDSGLPISGVTGTWGADARHVYSKQSAWSIDGSLLCVQNRSGGTPSILFLDGRTYEPLLAGCSGLYDYRWHPDPMHAREMINVDKSGRELSWIDIKSCEKERTWTLPITAAYGIGSGEGNVSSDGRFAVVANQTQLVVVDMDPALPFLPYPERRFGPVYTLPPCGFSSETCRVGNISISPSGRYIDVKYSGPDSYTQDVHRILEIDPMTLEVRPHEMAVDALRCAPFVSNTDGWIFPLKHADMGYDPFDNNEDVIVGGRSCPGATIGRIVKVRLRDGKVTPLTNPTGEASMQHVSMRNLYRPGWAYVGYYRQDGKRFSDEIVAVKLDGSGTTQSIAHKHSASDGCYRCESHPVPSPDGRRVLFASNWVQDCSGDCGPSTEIKDYVVDIQLTRPPHLVPLAGVPGGLSGDEDGDLRSSDDHHGLASSEGPPEPDDVVGGRDGASDRKGSFAIDGTSNSPLGVAAPALAFESVRPNPAVSGAEVVYTSSGGKSVDLELIDANGRTVQRQALGVPGPGPQHVRLDRSRGLAPGVYWLRLSTMESASTTKLIIVG
jgi:hypothetical protein